MSESPRNQTNGINSPNTRNNHIPSPTLTSTSTRPPSQIMNDLLPASSHSPGPTFPHNNQPSSPAPTTSSKTDTTSQANNPQNGATGHGGYEPDVGDSKEALEAYDWDDLEARFNAKMAECAKREWEIEDEFREWLEVTSNFSSYDLLFVPACDGYAQ
ncbi:hypothetical protein MMC28_006301 [Mycoblastus sanguinarius]|nr:hypothetical protein [Mycoblastus sanguinarius]